MYQFTKSIGFQLKSDVIKKLIPKSEKCNEHILFNDFKNQYNAVIKNFENTVFFENQEGEFYIKKHLEIKYPWVKQYAKDKFYEYNLNTKKKKICTIDNAPFLEDIFYKWINNSTEKYEKISEIISQPLETQQRNSDLAFYLRSIYSPEYFFFVRDFLLYAKDKYSDTHIKELEYSFSVFQPILEKCLSILAPHQTTGMEIARASFNFYTINKASKYYGSKKLEDVVKEKEEEKEKPYKKFLLDNNFLKDIGFEEYLKNWEGENGEKYLTYHSQKLSFNELYSALKGFKSSQKSAFNEAIYQEKWKKEDLEKDSINNIETKGKADLSKIERNKKFSFEDFFEQVGIAREVIQKDTVEKEKKQLKKFVKKNFPLFDAKEDVLWNFVQLTKEIKNLANQKNQVNADKKKISKELRQKREKRGEYFIKNWGFFQYSQKYCNNIYKKVAVDFGKLKAEIRGLKQEKIESRLLNYWAQILEKNNEKYLVLIPKIHISSAKKFLKTLQNTTQNSKLLLFNSLTLRALDKMIRKNYPKEISQKVGNIPFETDKQKIECYKKALSGELNKLQLDFSGFTEKISSIIKTKYTTVEDFRLDFEKVSYAIQKRTISNTDIETLKNKFGAIISKITSFDLEKKIENERQHTKYWRKFWTKNNIEEKFPLRLNPELRIFYRKPLKQNNEKKQNNRFSKDHFRVSFTFTQNAAQKELNTTFVNEKNLIQSIKKFNSEVIGNFTKKQENNLWYFGIDRGNQELATLGVVKWTNEKYEAILKDGTIKKFLKPKFSNLEVLEIQNPKDTKKIINNAKNTEVTVKISDNPSYFMNNEEEINKYFIKKTVSFIDLTTAKVVKGKIILNGDVKTYIQLKKVNAKRKLFNIFTQIENNVKVEYCDEDHPAWNIENKKGIPFFRNAFIIKKQNDQYQILCYFLQKQSKIYSKTNLQNDLQVYLDKLRKDGLMQEHTIEQINNLRDAITANMVGVISFLHEKYPAIINLENLQTKKEIDKQRKNNEENIARRLEWALYRKFQKKGLVPPNLKRTIFLREDFKNPLYQFGIIHFIPTEKTSSACPYCSTNTPFEERKNDKFGGEHFYECHKNKNCKFSTKDNRKSPLEKITNSDEVASYNIAKIPLVLKQRNLRRRK